MVSGVTYYAKVFSATTLQMNSSPDGGVPTSIDAAIWRAAILPRKIQISLAFP